MRTYGEEDEDDHGLFEREEVEDQNQQRGEQDLLDEQEAENDEGDHPNIYIQDESQLHQQDGSTFINDESQV